MLVVTVAVLAADVSPASAAAPRSLTAPTISGTPRQGRTLTTSNGTWDNNPTSFRYRWQRCDLQGAGCADVTGATRNTYTLVAADVDHTIRAVVTAVNADGATERPSRPTAVVSANTAPRNTVRPVITGTPKVGEELRVTTGTWTGGVRSFAFQWQRCDAAGATCVPVADATARTYGVRAADVGQTLRVEVTARNLAGSTSVTTDRTSVVLPATQPPPPPPPPPAGNQRPRLRLLSMRFVGVRVYARFRVCDDSGKNVTIIERDSRTGAGTFSRRFVTRVPPNPCGVYTRNWRPAARFTARNGRYVVTMWARDRAGLQSTPVRRTFFR